MVDSLKNLATIPDDVVVGGDSQRDDRDKRYVAMYDEQARNYDERSFSSRGGEFSKRYKNTLIDEMLRKYETNSQHRVLLDCPAGTGRMTHFIATDISCDEIIACDISPNMLEKNQQSMPETGAKVSFHVANMKSLPLESETVSVACVTSFLYLIPREEYSDYLLDLSLIHI